MDALVYKDAQLNLCLADKTKREIYDIVRQMYIYPARIRICPCIQDAWVRKTLEFLGAEYSNEPSHSSVGHGTH